MAALYDEGLLSYDARFNQPLICLTHLLLGPLTHSLIAIAPKYMTQNTPIPTILSMEVFVLLANQWKCGLSLSHWSGSPTTGQSLLRRGRRRQQLLTWWDMRFEIQNITELKYKSSKYKTSNIRAKKISPNIIAQNISSKYWTSHWCCQAGLATSPHPVSIEDCLAINLRQNKVT